MLCDQTCHKKTRDHFVMFAFFVGFLLTGAGGGGFLYAITKEAKFSEKFPELLKTLGVSKS